jgi:CcmD family protein
MSGLYYLLAANIGVWLAIFGYLVHLQLRCRKLNDMVEAMKKSSGSALGENSRGD